MTIARKRLYPAIKNSMLTTEQLMKVANLAEMLFHATIMIKNADQKRYGEIRKQCSNNYTMDKNTYPFAPVDTKNMIRQYEAIVESPASPIPTTDEEYYHDDSHYERAGVDEYDITTNDNIDDCGYGADDVANYNTNYYYSESHDNNETDDDSDDDDHYNENNNYESYDNDYDDDYSDHAGQNNYDYDYDEDNDHKHDNDQYHDDDESEYDDENYDENEYYNENKYYDENEYYDNDNAKNNE